MNDDFICVLQTMFPPQAEIVAGALRATGIDAHVFTSHMGGEGMPQSRVMVPAALADDAREVMAELEREG